MRESEEGSEGDVEEGYLIVNCSVASGLLGGGFAIVDVAWRIRRLAMQSKADNAVILSGHNSMENSVEIVSVSEYICRGCRDKTFGGEHNSLESRPKAPSWQTRYAFHDPYKQLSLFLLTAWSAAD